MNRVTHRALSLPFALATALASSVALAAPGAPAASAADIRAVCPGIDAALQESLSPAWSRVGEPGVVRVQMDVQGQKVTRVTTSGGPSAYSSDIKRAVRKLSCSGGSEQAQALGFELSFVGPDNAEGTSARSSS